MVQEQGQRAGSEQPCGDSVTGTLTSSQPQVKLPGFIAWGETPEGGAPFLMSFHKCAQSIACPVSPLSMWAVL